MSPESSQILRIVYLLSDAVALVVKEYGFCRKEYRSLSDSCPIEGVHR